MEEHMKLKRYFINTVVITIIMNIFFLLPVFADDNLVEARYTVADGTFREGTIVEAFNNVSDKGTISLLKDISLDTQITIEDKKVTLLGNNHVMILGYGVNITLGSDAVLYLGDEDLLNESIFNLCSTNNPCTNQSTTNAPLITLNENAKLYMYDQVTLGPSIADSSAAGVTINGDSIFYMYGGTITSCITNAEVSGGVYLDENGQFHMYDGIIERCEGCCGGAVGIASGNSIGTKPASKAVFHMHDGIIQDCKDKKGIYANGGGAVCIDGRIKQNNWQVQFIMDDGVIKNCETVDRGGGAIYMFSYSEAQLVLNGGTISGSSCEDIGDGYGGAVYINSNHQDANVLLNNTIRENRGKIGGGIFVMRGKASIGATITGNKASKGGGGIFGNNGDVLINENAKLYGNSAEGSGGDDLYCNSGCFVTLNANNSDCLLLECKHFVDGWYWDEAGSGYDRWNCANLATAVRFMPPEEGFFDGAALKAAHGQNPQCAIKVSFTGKGNISPEGPIVKVNTGDSLSFTFAPSYGYMVDEVLIDGNHIDNTENYEFTNIQSSHSIDVKFIPIQYNITYNLDGGIVESSNPKNYTIESPTFTLTNPSRAGYIFLGWTQNMNSDLQKRITINQGTTGDLNFTAHWQKDNSGDSGTGPDSDDSTSNTYYVRYHNDDDTVKDGKFIPGETVTVKGNVFTAPVGKVLTGWSLEEDGKVDYKVGDIFRMPGSSIDLYAVWENAETESHSAYISGYPDGTVGPDKTITRAEAATMFYNLLTDKNGDTKAFTDVPANQWYTKAVTTLAGKGIISGYPDGTFKPNALITRAEFVTMAMNFANADQGVASGFPDVQENMWYYGPIAGATQNGWISGYPDGTFGPDRYITRAEVTSVINRMENRAADTSFMMDHLDELRTFSDLGFDHWAYGSMMEAANGHEYVRESAKSYEVWVNVQ